MSGTLSPSELQSLFGGLDLSRTVGSSIDSAAAQIDANQYALPLSLVAAEEVGLQAWHAAFIARWKQSWLDSIRTRWSIVSVACEAIRLRDFVAAHANWHCFQVSSTRPEFTHWLAVDECLAASHLDGLLGANQTDTATTSPRKWGPLERQLTARLVHSASSSLFPASQESQPVTWQIHAVNTVSDWIAGVPFFLSCELVQFHIEINCAGTIGHLHVAVPRTTTSRWLEARGASVTSPNHSAHDSASESVTLRATLAPITLSQTEFDQLQVGDVLLTGQEALGKCRVSINDETKFAATIGSHQGHKAVRLLADSV